MKRLSFVFNKLSFDSVPMIEKSSQATAWSQFNMWPLIDLDGVPLNRLPVLGDKP